MSYDYYTASNQHAGHNSPLLSSAQDPENVGSIADTTTFYEHSLLVPRQKINMGANFYGYRFSFPGADLWRACSGVQSCAGIGVTETITYAQVQRLQSTEPRQWRWRFDAIASAPYAVRVDSTAFLSFDSAQSTTAKVRRAVREGLGGSFAWEISQDWTPPGNAHPLIDAMAAGLAPE